MDSNIQDIVLAQAQEDAFELAAQVVEREINSDPTTGAERALGFTLAQIAAEIRALKG
ncbi:hypothetical protein ACFPM3_20115 [Streptomyces coeruleoprunus]|uniref:Uncharacterized protein n=1 Tax=Streptomyces coeruleoprunus TaxID=285563 RepID=A0ABV9XGR7_9ACTN